MYNNYRTPTKEERDTALGSVITPRQKRKSPGKIPLDLSIPPKTVYLIRHGESMGQVATRERRSNDSSLTDCGLTPLGEEQALKLPEQLPLESIQLVLTSPLRRALQTALMAFRHHPIVVYYDLREIGSAIPENTPRDIVENLRDIQIDCPAIDFQTFRPRDWPKRHNASPRVVRRDRIRTVLEWLLSPECTSFHTVALVCHYHVIRTLLQDPWDLHHNSNVFPQNAQPIKCHLYNNGSLHICHNKN